MLRPERNDLIQQPNQSALPVWWRYGRRLSGKGPDVGFSGVTAARSWPEWILSSFRHAAISDRERCGSGSLAATGSSLSIACREQPFTQKPRMRQCRSKTVGVFLAQHLMKHQRGLPIAGTAEFGCLLAHVAK